MLLQLQLSMLLQLQLSILLQLQVGSFAAVVFVNFAVVAYQCWRNCRFMLLNAATNADLLLQL